MELSEIASKDKDKDYVAGNLVRQIKNYYSFILDYDDNTKVKKLELFPEALKNFMKNKENKWLFFQEGDGELMPYFIMDCKYHKKYKSGDYWVPAHTDINLRAYKRGKQIYTTVTLHASDIGLSVSQILTSEGIFIETPEAVENYISEFQRFTDIQVNTGLQMYATGTAESEGRDRWYYSRTSKVAMTRDGVPTKIIIDDFDPEEEDKKSRSSSSSDSLIVSARFWQGQNVKADYLQVGAKPTKEEDEEDDDRDVSDNVKLPIHPYVRIFDLDKHEYLTIHIANLEDYPWDESLFDKLVLPEEQKSLVRMLVENTSESVDDIVRGKMSGVIVMATGYPGTGKTLTAEVFSETIKKPLYVVQCSQLGLSVNEIEGNLKEILSHAAKWGAILLIDEADVYIRERGDDINQNAIVGVFLRILEYYKGVLFMTSNRGNIIDDAIMSRATAWIQYDLPDNESLKNIWKVLGHQYKADLSEQDIDKLVEKLNRISGRTVRNLLKLARLKSKHDGVEIDANLIIQVSAYQQLESNKKDYISETKISDMFR